MQRDTQRSQRGWDGTAQAGTPSPRTQENSPSKRMFHVSKPSV